MMMKSYIDMRKLAGKFHFSKDYLEQKLIKLNIKHPTLNWPTSFAMNQQYVSKDQKYQEDFLCEKSIIDFLKTQLNDDDCAYQLYNIVTESFSAYQQTKDNPLLANSIYCWKKQDFNQIYQEYRERPNVMQLFLNKIQQSSHEFQTFFKQEILLPNEIEKHHVQIQHYNLDISLPCSQIQVNKIKL